MADESTPSGEQTQAPDGTQQDDDGEGEPLQDAAKLLETLRKERAARKALEKEVKPLRSFKQEREDAEKTEQQKRDERIAELEGRLTAAQQRERSYALRDAIEEALAGEQVALVAPLPRLLKLIDAEAVQWTDDGQPKNAAALLKGLVKSDPYLFAQRRGPSGDGGAGRTGAVAPSMNDLIRAARGH